MLDDFRQQADSSFFEEDAPPPEPERRVRKQFLGMGPFQRFIVSLLLLLLTCMLSSFCLLMTNRVGLF